MRIRITLVVPMDLYIILTGIGVFGVLFSFFTDYELLLSKYIYGIVVGVLSWGVLGWAGMTEPYPLVVGSIFMLIINGLLWYLTTDGTELSEFILREARVTVAIPVDQKKAGEIVIEDKGGSKIFIMARSEEEIKKPIPKDSNVRIISVEEGNVALVAEKIKLADRSISQLSHYFFKFIDMFTPKERYSGICTICFSTIAVGKAGTRCPHCSHVAHLEHMEEWLKYKNICPNCRQGVELQGSRMVKVLSH